MKVAKTDYRKKVLGTPDFKFRLPKRDITDLADSRNVSVTDFLQPSITGERDISVVGSEILQRSLSDVISDDASEEPNISMLDTLIANTKEYMKIDQDDLTDAAADIAANMATVVRTYLPAKLDPEEPKEQPKISSMMKMKLAIEAELNNLKPAPSSPNPISVDPPILPSESAAVPIPSQQTIEELLAVMANLEKAISTFQISHHDTVPEGRYMRSVRQPGPPESKSLQLVKSIKAQVDKLVGAAPKPTVLKKLAAELQLDRNPDSRATSVYNESAVSSPRNGLAEGTSSPKNAESRATSVYNDLDPGPTAVANFRSDSGSSGHANSRSESGSTVNANVVANSRSDSGSSVNANVVANSRSESGSYTRKNGKNSVAESRATSLYNESRPSTLKNFADSGSCTPKDVVISGSSTPKNVVNSGSSTPKNVVNSGSSTPNNVVISGSSTPKNVVNSGSSTPKNVVPGSASPDDYVAYRSSGQYRTSGTSQDSVSSTSVVRSNIGNAVVVDSHNFNDVLYGDLERMTIFSKQDNHQVPETSPKPTGNSRVSRPARKYCENCSRLISHRDLPDLFAEQESSKWKTCGHCIQEMFPTKQLSADIAWELSGNAHIPIEWENHTFISAKHLAMYLCGGSQPMLRAVETETDLKFIETNDLFTLCVDEEQQTSITRKILQTQVEQHPMLQKLLSSVKGVIHYPDPPIMFPRQFDLIWMELADQFNAKNFSS